MDDIEYTAADENLRDALRDEQFDNQCPLRNRAGETCAYTHHDGPHTWETP